MKKLTAIAAFILLAGLTRTLDDRIERIASEIDSTVGVAAFHVESGRRFAVRAGETFPMGSVGNVPVAIAFLRQVDAGRHSLSSEVTIQPAEFAQGHSPLRDGARGRAVTITLQRALDAMLLESDNTASAVMEKLIGGNDLEIRGDVATPAAMLSLLEKLYVRQTGLSGSSHDLLMRTLIASPTGERRIRAGAPARAQVAHKTATMPGSVNDAGIITSPDGKDHVLIVVFTKGGQTSTLTQRERAVATITRAVYRDFVGWSPFRRARQ